MRKVPNLFSGRNCSPNLVDVVGIQAFAQLSCLRKSFVISRWNASAMEYCCPVWHGAERTRISSLSGLQRRSLDRVHNLQVIEMKEASRCAEQILGEVSNKAVAPKSRLA
jgi:hypothetical protein